MVLGKSWMASVRFELWGFSRIAAVDAVASKQAKIPLRGGSDTAERPLGEGGTRKKQRSGAKLILSVEESDVKKVL